MDVSTARQRSRTYADLAHAFSEAEPGLEQEFTRLFLGPGRPVAHPYGSVYREGRTMGETTLDVRCHLAREGLAPNGQRLPDHVSIELAFMAHLAAREALAWDSDDGDAVWCLLQQQEAFLREHLGAWLPQFCRRILTGNPSKHYAQLAQRVETFVASDAENVRSWLGDSVQAAGSLGMEWEWWTVNVGQRCTLCHICVEVCQTGALLGIRDEQAGIIRLGFEPARCDGCAVCEGMCPEGAIRVRRVQDGVPVVKGELARSTLLACPACGRLHIPEALVSGLVDRLGAAQEALARRLLLCYDCKATDAPLRRRDATQQIVPNLARDVPLSHGRSR